MNSNNNFNNFNDQKEFNFNSNLSNIFKSQNLQNKQNPQSHQNIDITKLNSVDEPTLAISINEKESHLNLTEISNELVGIHNDILDLNTITEFTENRFKRYVLKNKI